VVERLISLIVTGLDVTMTGPLALPVLKLMVNVSGPSVKLSDEGDIEKEPTLAVILKDPDDAEKSESPT
jgi:hypothetical protein